MKSSMINICTIVPQSTGNEEEESQAAAQLVLGGKMMLHDGKKIVSFLKQHISS